MHGAVGEACASSLPKGTTSIFFIISDNFLLPAATKIAGMSEESVLLHRMEETTIVWHI